MKVITNLMIGFAVATVLTSCSAPGKSNSSPSGDVPLLTLISEQTDMDWSSQIPSMNAENIWLGEVFINERELQGTRIEAPGKSIENYRDQLTSLLREQGWNTWQPVGDADGPNGSMWGYAKYTNDHLDQIILFSWNKFPETHSEIFISQLIE